MIITLKNNFHNTEATIRVKQIPSKLSYRQTQRVRRALCGMEDCYCGDVRGPQDEVFTEEDYDDDLQVVLRLY